MILRFREHYRITVIWFVKALGHVVPFSFHLKILKGLSGVRKSTGLRFLYWEGVAVAPYGASRIPPKSAGDTNKCMSCEVQRRELLHCYISIGLGS